MAKQLLEGVFNGFGEGFEQGGAGDKALDKATEGVDRAFGRVANKITKNIASDGAIGRAVNEASKLVWGNLYGRPLVYTVFGVLGVATAGYGSRVLWNYIERQLLTPRVITEYYKQRWFSGLNPFAKKVSSPKMVFPKVLDERLTDLIEETKAIRATIKSGVKSEYRNILLYGPPGTGKTMFAKKFAHESGMDFAFVPGASLFQKGAGIKVVQELFAWAKNSKNGLCLFIDEADALFIDRATMNQSDENYGTLNYLLTELGEASNKFVVIATTNYHNRFDKTMERRFGEAVEMLLPGFDERVATLKLYRDSILFDTKNSPEYIVQAKKVLTESKINKIAELTDGFCYDDFQKMINAIRVSPRGQNGPTEKVVDQIFANYIAKKAAFAGTKKVDAKVVPAMAASAA